MRWTLSGEEIYESLQDNFTDFMKKELKSKKFKSWIRLMKKQPFYQDCSKLPHPATHIRVAMCGTGKVLNRFENDKLMQYMAADKNSEHHFVEASIGRERFRERTAISIYMHNLDTSGKFNKLQPIQRERLAQLFIEEVLPKFGYDEKNDWEMDYSQFAYKTKKQKFFSKAARYFGNAFATWMLIVVPYCIITGSETLIISNPYWALLTIVGALSGADIFFKHFFENDNK